jgi:diguanylate cyclase (GGDEF)-like protein
LPEELPSDVLRRSEQALGEAKKSGGNCCFWHGGEASFPVSSAFKCAERAQRPDSASLPAMFRRSIVGLDADEAVESSEQSAERPILTGRSLFVANLQRRIAEWKRGGIGVSVVVLRVDQREELMTQFGSHAQRFLHGVLERLLEAVTRDMDERCELEDGLFALLLPGADESNALAVADRLKSQIRQCKIRMSDALWDITASIGVAHCSCGESVVDIMKGAERAMKQAVVAGGDAISVATATPAEALHAAAV